MLGPTRYKHIQKKRERKLIGDVSQKLLFCGTFSQCKPLKFTLWKTVGTQKTIQYGNLNNDDSINF